MENDTLVNIVDQKVKFFKEEYNKPSYNFLAYKGNSWRNNDSVKKMIEENKYHMDKIDYVICKGTTVFSIFYKNFCICKTDSKSKAQKISYNKLNLVYQSCSTKVKDFGKYENKFHVFSDDYSKLLILDSSSMGDCAILLARILNSIFKHEILPKSSSEKMNYYLNAYRDCTKKYGQSYFDVLNACVDYSRQYNIYSSDLNKYSGYRESLIAYAILYGDNKKLFNKFYNKYALKSGVDVSKKTTSKIHYKAYLDVFNMAKPYLLKSIKTDYFESYSWYFIWVNTILLHANKANIDMDSSFYDEVNVMEDRFYSFLERNEMYHINPTTGEITRIVLAQGAFNTFYRIGNIFYEFPKIRNYNKALKWFEYALMMDKADENENYADIRYFEALCLRDGLANVELNRDRMVEHLKEGASRGHAGCEYELYKYYAHLGDSYSANIWKKKAESHGIKSDEDNERYKQGVLQKTSNIIGTISSIVQGGSGVASAIVTIVNAVSLITDRRNN